MFISSKFLALGAVISCAFALRAVPQLDSIPGNAASLAHDTDREVLIAYDRWGNVLGELSPANTTASVKRDDPAPAPPGGIPGAGTCATLSASDAQKLPGWDTIAQYMKDNWGDGWDTINTNPSDYPDRGAQMCITGDITTVTMDGDPRCTTQSQTTSGKLVGADGTVALAALQGTAQSTTVTVTSQSAVAIGASVSAKVAIPELMELTATVSTTVTITNTLITANTVSSNNQQTQTVTLQNKAGKTCSLQFDVHTCDATGHGSQKMLATGWVWVYYGERRNGHYKWAVHIDNVMDEGGRESNIGFSTTTSSNTASKYNAVCTPEDPPPPAPEPSPIPTSDPAPPPEPSPDPSPSSDPAPQPSPDPSAAPDPSPQPQPSPDPAPSSDPQPSPAPAPKPGKGGCKRRRRK